MTFPPMAVEAHHLHLLAPQLLIDRELVPKLMDPHQPGFIGRKRSREQISSDFQQQMFDHDRLIIHHAQQITSQLAEQQKRYSNLLFAAVEHEVRKQLKAKDDEIENVKKLNWALEERVRSLCIENQVWKELAQTNEATVNLLSANLEQVLSKQSCSVKQEEQEIYIEQADDAESCCCGDNEGFDQTAMDASTALRVCRSCGVSAATVLILPCRHLCLCGLCSPTVDFCPICRCAANGSVNVNFS